MIGDRRLSRALRVWGRNGLASAVRRTASRSSDRPSVEFFGFAKFTQGGGYRRACSYFIVLIRGVGECIRVMPKEYRTRFR